MGKRIYLGNVPFEATEQDIRTFFTGFNVTEVKIITDKETGRPRGFVFVELDSEGAVQEAVADLDGTDMGGRTLKVSEALDKPRGNSGGGRGSGRERRDDRRNGDGRGRRD